VWDEKALIQKETHPRDRGATEAISDYRVVESFRDTSLVEVQLQTGRRNQIRIQARLRGHTLVGEKRYTYGPDALRTIQFERHALHAWKLGFDHPPTAGHWSSRRRRRRISCAPRAAPSLTRPTAHLPEWEFRLKAETTRVNPCSFRL
jgi:23S rRNA-/tRNA-specific pseudouridylate synthase